MTKSGTGRMPIGEMSKLTGCNIETIRYYERIGVMPDPVRSTGGHRLYVVEHLKRLTFIRRSRELGFTLKQIRELLAMVDGGAFTCNEIKEITTGHIGDVRRKIADLRRLERVLADMASRCDRGEVPDCPVIDALFEGGV